MRRKRRIISDAERCEILGEAAQARPYRGIKAVARRHKIHPSTIYNWRSRERKHAEPQTAATTPLEKRLDMISIVVELLLENRILRERLHPLT